ncbi:hypothetical protein RHSIM_Rhsim02G0253000 [Rhododendron simsii]|uniref:Uncharacterized protein n=1 Tax=Rhododendron simsii TaxID=118357 RepID=A0A834LTU6_RHOSS|nr:hypothetical protein RHSIM_Rhsim02G0253000 [Rhododendron simsii]
MLGRTRARIRDVTLGSYTDISRLVGVIKADVLSPGGYADLAEQLICAIRGSSDRCSELPTGKRIHECIQYRISLHGGWTVRPVMESELETAKAQITELKAEVEYERKARKKMESVNKKLNRELSEERKGREALERVCGELAREISAAKAEINRMKKEMEEERKMLRMAEVFREERVQMKLAEAKILLEDKISELEETKQMRTEPSNQVLVNNVKPVSATTNATDIFSVKLVRCGSGEKSTYSVDNGGSGIANSLPIQRRRSPEAENPHIKRGIKGFVEFPKVVRAIGSRSRHLGSKMECQRAQLRILLKQKNPTRSNGLIMS